MKTVSLVFGILSIIGMLIAFIPCLGWLNWVNIPFAVVGLVFGILAISLSNYNEPKGNAIAGLALCAAAIFLGIIRLVVGGGIF